MKIRIICIVLIVLGLFKTGSSQNNLREKRIRISQDTLVLDSLLILPATLQIFHRGKAINPEWYRLIPGRGQLIANKQLQAIKDSLQIQYRIYQYQIGQEYFTRSSQQINPFGSVNRRSYVISSSFGNRGILSNDQLEKQGSYLRGISYGNQQDVVTNSSLNLQLSGKLSDDIHILAAISDNNIPIQPDGNTQNIQDFDRIFIKLFNDDQELILGDYQIESPEGEFMRFNKKVQGGKYSGMISKDQKGNRLLSTLSASIAKGKFKRMEIVAQEGIQGPYRLSGLNNESYIIVLAGSEKVFLDGKRLTRGEQNDYVINYNTAELSFTTKHAISYQSRIIVEFEYSEESYSRFLIFNANEYQSKKGKFWLNIYSEQDSKNQSIDQSLSTENKVLLSQIGDDLGLAVVPNEEEVEYSNEYVLYQKISKTIDNQAYEIYEYSTDPTATNYRVSFSYVGENEGNYQLLNSNVNGRVYQWIDPVNGIPQGNYAPVSKLIPPQKQQMVSLGMDYQLGEQIHTRMELALSNRDLNTFSTLDDGNNKGLAANMSIEKKTEFADTSKQLLSRLNLHFIQKNFEEIENFRSVEFDRDWNIESSLDGRNEHFLSLENTFRNDRWGAGAYEISYLDREADYRAIRQMLGTRYQKKKISLEFQGNLLNTDQQNVESKFYRHRLDLAYNSKWARFGVLTENENNQFKQKSDRQLLANSFSFYSYRLYLESPDSTENRYQAYYQKRQDDVSDGSKLTAITQSEDFGAQIWLQRNRKNQLHLQSIYRRLSVLNTSLSSQKPENTFLGKLEHSARIGKGLLSSSTYYELGSGLESEKEYTYVQVNDGQGVYKWTDYNSNGIKELNEFDVATFQDEANYLRIANITNTYNKVYTSEFRQSFYLQLRRLKGKSGMLRWLKNFRNRFAYRIAKKSLNKDFNLYANPFYNPDLEENLNSISSGIQNTLSHRNAKSKTSWDILLVNNRSKNLLTQGFERRKFSSTGFRFNWRMGKSNQLTNRTDQIEKSLYHENFASQDYRLREIKNELQLKFQPYLVFQFGLSYLYSRKENQLASEKSTMHNIGANCQYSIQKNGKLQANINYLHLDYNASSNSSIAYEMLEAYLPGNNASWRLSYQQKLSKVFQMNISYNGRMSEKANTIHVGSMEIRAYF